MLEFAHDPAHSTRHTRAVADDGILREMPVATAVVEVVEKLDVIVLSLLLTTTPVMFIPPVPALIFTAVAPVVLPIVTVLAFAPVPTLTAPVVPLSKVAAPVVPDLTVTVFAAGA